MPREREIGFGGECQKGAHREGPLPMRVGPRIVEAWQLYLQKRVPKVAGLPPSHLHQPLACLVSSWNAPQRSDGGGLLPFEAPAFPLGNVGGTPCGHQQLSC